MRDPYADAQLELACRVGSLGDIVDALEDGADINVNGCSPLFIGIMAGDREVVSVLLERGADVSVFELDATEPEEIVNALMKLAPASSNGDEEEADADPVDAKLVRAFDRMIRNKGLVEPFRKKRGGEYAAFLDGLQWIAAEDCLSCAKEFLELIAEIPTDDSDARDAAFEANAGRIAELGERYIAVEDLPGDLLREYLKERKKRG